jgi:hypothetical protein
MADGWPFGTQIANSIGDGVCKRLAVWDTASHPVRPFG